MLDFVMEKASPADIGLLYELETSCFPLPWSQQSLSLLLEQKDRGFCLKASPCDESSLILGYVGFLYVLDEGEITKIAVAPSFRNHGIGSALLLQLISLAAAQGIAKIHLEVSINNKTAISLYEKNGFCIVGKRKNYYADTGEDAMIMTREI